MPGTITIRLKAGCDPDSVTMVLSGTAEPDGGDHYAQINWYYNNAVAKLLTIEMETSPGVWVGVPGAFLFTSAGETYTLRASGPEYIINDIANLKFPYKVYGVYAPDWASVFGDINTIGDDSPCCVPTGETSGYEVLHNRPLLGTTGVANESYPTCGPKVSAPYTIIPSCNAYTITDTVTPACGAGVYDWVDKSGGWTFNFSYADTCNSTSATATLSVTITKVSGESIVHITATYATSVSGSFVGGESTVNTNDVQHQEGAVPCSDYIMQVDATFAMSCGVGGSSSSISYIVSLYHP